MADTKALRRLLEEEIRRLQEDLQAIERVEQVSQRLDLHRESPSGSHQEGTHGDDLANRSVINACKIVITESHKPWAVASVFKEVTRRGKPGVTRAAVSVALRRLASSGLIKAQKSEDGRMKYMAGPPLE